MVAMSGDSYLLKVPTPPCQASHACRKGAVRSTSCGVVVSMVLLLGAVLGLAGMAYFLRLELCTLRAEGKERETDVSRRVEYLSSKMTEMDDKLSRLNMLQQIKTFEAMPPPSTAGTDLGTEYEDPTDLIYDDLESDFPLENRANDEAQNRPANVPKLEPAGSLVRPAVAAPVTPAAKETTDSHPSEEDDTDDTDDMDPDDPDYQSSEFPQSGELPQSGEHHHRDRRAVASASAANRRGEPQLKLYHMLQAPGSSLAVAPPPSPAEPWSYHGSYRPDSYPQPMYAEHAPTDFVTAPRRHATTAATAATPIASRRSRVMDAGNVHEAAPRQRHRSRTGRRQQGLQGQRQQQQQQYGDARLQDVSQDPQDTGRSVEVGRRQGLGRRYDEQHGPWRTPVPAGDPYWRGARSIDSSVEVAQTWRPYAPMVVGPAIAAHFVANTSRPEHRRHPHRYHHDGFGRHQHEEGLYADWTASAWLQDLGLDHHFDVSDSQIAIKTPGLYLVYAQVNYANEKEENGFWVVRNGNSNELLCYVTSPSPSLGGGGGVRANTCFTAGVLRLAAGDRLSVKDLSGGRYRVLDHAGRSFVGLVNLSACKPKSE